MARAIWSGALSFGLVNVPVKVFSATRQHDIHFHQLAPDGSRIQMKRVSTKTSREVEFSDIKKGFETTKGKYVVFEQGELKDLAPATTKTIDIEDFVPLDEIDPIYYERTYYLAPAGEGAARAYALLATVMSERERVGIGKVVMREKQYLAAVRPYGKGLALSTMLFADEIVDPSDIDGMPARKPTLAPREKQMASQFLDSLAHDWDPKRYHDDYEEQLRAIIKAKAKGKTIEAAEPEEKAPELDLLEALKASLDKASSRRKPATRTSKSRTRAAATHAKKRSKSTSRSRP